MTKELIIAIQKAIDNNDKQSYCIMSQEKSTAVRVANHFRNEGYICFVDTINASIVLFRITVTKP